MKGSKRIFMAILTSLVLVLASPAMTALAARDVPVCQHEIHDPHTTMYHIRTIDHGDGTYTFWYRCHLCGYEKGEKMP